MKRVIGIILIILGAASIVGNASLHATGKRDPLATSLGVWFVEILLILIGVKLCQRKKDAGNESNKEPGQQEVPPYR